MTKGCKLGDLNNRNFLAHDSGGWKSETKVLVSAGLILSEGYRVGSVSCLSP